MEDLKAVAKATRLMIPENNKGHASLLNSMARPDIVLLCKTTVVFDHY